MPSVAQEVECCDDTLQQHKQYRSALMQGAVQFRRAGQDLRQQLSVSFFKCHDAIWGAIKALWKCESIQHSIAALLQHVSTWLYVQKQSLLQWMTSEAVNDLRCDLALNTDWIQTKWPAETVQVSV